MRTYLSVIITVSLLLGFSSCSEKSDIYEDIKTVELGEEAILSFGTKEELNASINLATEQTKSGIDLSGNLSLPKGESLLEQENYTEEMSEFVPNPSFAKLLNKKGEIVVENMIYKITPNGTYYFEKNKRGEFDALYEKDSFIKGEPVGDKLYLIASGIYRYDTFHKEESEINYVEQNSEIGDVITKSGSHTGVNPNLDAMDWFTADRTTLLGKIVQNLFGSTKEFAKYYPHTDKRRVKGSFYFYNYVAYAEIGAQGWTDKKNWIGWSKTEADDLRVGWRNVVLVTKIPDTYRNTMNTMTNLSRSVSSVQYMDVPGTMHKVNMKTMVIPDFNTTEFEKALNNGAVQVFNWLKSQCSQNQTDWEQAEAALVISRTHLFTVFRDQDVRKLYCKSYTHVFASQAKFMISVNLASFPQTIADYKQLLVNIVKNSSDMAYPTLANGDMYVAAKFGDYWQGMRINKREADVLRAMNL
jgi:hypothetical protein